MIRFLLFLVLLLAIWGCQASGSRSEVRVSDDVRNPQRAVELTQEAIDLMARDPTKAAELLHLAIDADLYHGPAHNNLGVLMLHNGELYAAAEAFDLARRLMPGHPDPRINLGIALERGGRITEALEAYASAIEVYPGNLPSIQAMTRLQIRSGDVDESTEHMLRTIVARGDKVWAAWARTQLTSGGFE